MTRETVPCPTCNGHGTVARESTPATEEPAWRPPASARDRNGLCSCDGPPHRWTAGWCPP